MTHAKKFLCHLILVCNSSNKNKEHQHLCSQPVPYQRQRTSRLVFPACFNKKALLGFDESFEAEVVVKTNLIFILLKLCCVFTLMILLKTENLVFHKIICSLTLLERSTLGVNFKLLCHIVLLSSLSNF